MLISEWSRETLYISEITDLHFAFHCEAENLEEEIFQSESQFKALSEEASKKENDYKNYKEDFANKIKCLEVSFVVLFINLGNMSDG